MSREWMINLKGFSISAGNIKTDVCLAMSIVPGVDITPEDKTKAVIVREVELYCKVCGDRVGICQHRDLKSELSKSELISINKIQEVTITDLRNDCELLHNKIKKVLNLNTRGYPTWQEWEQLIEDLK